MNVIGIAAEYNPFHNGHALHIARARGLLDGPGTAVAAVLSSAFTQRGLPALADKWTRTRMALLNGADLVLELPFLHACNGGAEFAGGAVDILAGTGFVTHISFGMENPFEPGLRSSPFETILDILLQEPPSFKLSLKNNLASGQSYPKAIAGALDRELPGSGDLASTPNNSLALSYLLHIRRKRYNLISLPIQREGPGYHDGPDGGTERDTRSALLAGAAAIRKGLFLGEAWTAKAMPASVSALLEEARADGRLCTGTSTKTLWTLLRGLLLRSTPEELRQFAGMDEGLENLFLKHFPRAVSYEDFIGRCVCARYTRGRLQRASIRLLTGLGRKTPEVSREGPPFIRVLGFNRRGRELLRASASALRRGAVLPQRAALPQCAALPLVTRLAAARLTGNGQSAERYVDMEFRASRLWELLVPAPDLRREERQKPVDLS
ncbi:MAG: nucleotidyltransferase family protein [Synergistaceae bacterium]|jgi:predicted nucleotidyltransferase|nr:nucleotidyltransferase family protein [Synergistaceae bacterium]